MKKVIFSAVAFAFASLVIAAGVWTKPKTLRVEWHLLDATQKGTFEVVTR